MILSPHLWRGLDELRDLRSELSPVSSDRPDEFPAGVSSWDDSLSRRRFLEIMGASLALVGLGGCMRAPREEIISRAVPPEKRIPGLPLHYATTLRVHGAPRGVVVTQTEGRPTHIEGNRLHSLSGGAADIWTIAALLDLYHPDRLAALRSRGLPSTWEAFQEEMGPWKAEAVRTGGKGLHLLTEPICSPTEWEQIARLLATFPEARWHQYDPVAGESPVDSDGRPLTERLALQRADVIFTLEADFLFDRPESLSLIRQFSRRRSGSSCNRLYAVESGLSLTGIRADHRWALSPTAFEALALQLRDAIAGHGVSDPRWPWLEAVADDLRRHAGRSVLLAGESLPATVRQAFWDANLLLGNAGRTIFHTPLLPDRAPRPHSLRELAESMEKNEVGTLVMIGGNPVFDAPVDWNFAENLRRVPRAIHHALFTNETSSLCGWIVPATHDLEAWGDARSVDGTLSLRQPLIAPLYDGHSEIELLSLLVDPVGRTGHEIVRERWRKTVSGGDDTFEENWRRWLHDGVVSSAVSAKAISTVRFPDVPASVEEARLWVSFRPDASLWDGRHADNGWLQELPDPITKLTWGNAALVGPATAERLGLGDGDVAELVSGGIVLRIPILRLPGHAEGGFTLPLGYGRTVAGSLGKGVGTDVFSLRQSNGLRFASLDRVRTTGERRVLALTQHHSEMEGRDLIRIAKADETILEAAPVPTPSLYPEVLSKGYAWGMTIDLGTCIGCNACMVACQSENNIPVVGPDQVIRGREMHWIRVDRYFSGPAESPEAHFQPVPCMHCEKAPCEVVCPVGATLHSDEGLNEMVYNRCVGTRYCSNNCPYKVRRFNFLEYNAHHAESEKLRLNPNVTVRSRGVMEKCTYCVQRIETARIAADGAGRPIGSNEIVTACQSACPAEAIVFGDINDPQSAVSLSRARSGRYALLEELDTRPRTTYLPKRINPNPALEEKG